MRIRFVILPLTVLLTAGCADTGPTDLGQVCDAYKNFRSEYNRPHILSNKGVFSSMRKLGDVVSRYPDDSDISKTGPRLKAMGESDSFNIFELESATSSIKSACT